MDLNSKIDEFDSLLIDTQRDGIENLINWLHHSTDFYTAPASTKYHLSCDGGLLTHSLNVYHQLARLMTIYNSFPIPLHSLKIVALLHDVCKVNMYKKVERYRKNDKKQWEAYYTYEINDSLPFGGHASKSLYMVQRFIYLTYEEASAINTHMGLGEWADHIDDVYKVNPLAWLLHVADESATFIIEKGE